jgi:phosphocarrier protein HPr
MQKECVDMIKKDFIMNCNEGFHLRPAQVLTETATGFASAILLHKNDGSEMTSDAKSILGLMSLGLEHGQSVTVTAEGADEAAAMDAVQKLFETNFGE